MDYLEIASFIGIFAFALSGTLIGIYKKLDAMGIFILAFLTSSGGGIVRDVLLNKVPSVLTNISTYLIIFFIIVAFKLLRIDHEKLKFEEKVVFILSDTVGFIAFAINGTLQGIASNLSFFGVLIITLLTAVGGGVIRDILVNEIPNVLRSGFYGTAAITIGVLIYTLNLLEINLQIILPFIFIVGITIRFRSLINKITVPKRNHKNFLQ